MYNHFEVNTLKYTFLELPLFSGVREDDTELRFVHGCGHLVERCEKQLAVVLAMLAAIIVGTVISCRELLSNERWQFVPTLFVVALGIGISSTAFAFLRLRASIQLRHIASQSPDGQFEVLMTLLDHQAEIVSMGLKSAVGED